MLNILKPDMWVSSIWEIDIKTLENRGINKLIIDMDNTLTPWNNHNILEEAKGWIDDARQMGFKICILSNNSQSRVQEFASSHGVLAAPKGGKPSIRAFTSALTVLQGDSTNTAVVGDQIFTDILGGNRVGLYTILVNPISEKEFVGTRLARMMERLILGRRYRQ